MTPISERQSARLLYTKRRKMRKVFTDIKKARHFTKARQFLLRFYSQKARHFTLRDFHDFFEIGIYIYKKSMKFALELS